MVLGIDNHVIHSKGLNYILLTTNLNLTMEPEEM